jgi:hypothetical protein
MAGIENDSQRDCPENRLREIADEPDEGGRDYDENQQKKSAF